MHWGFAVLLILPLAVSCAGEQAGDGAQTSRPSTDWHNKIEYDGSFYVSPEIKLLYSMDKGSITLWDDGGEGDVLQTLSYNTTVPDAMENLIRTDVNGDGYADLQTKFSEEQGQTCYNLWLWSEQTGQYQICGMYRLIKNPNPDPEDGTVSSLIETEAFGTMQSTYQFTDALDLETISQEITDADSVASNDRSGSHGRRCRIPGCRASPHWGGRIRCLYGRHGNRWQRRPYCVHAGWPFGI